MKDRDVRASIFKNEILGVLPGEVFVLFCGLWCFSDREGLFEWKPLKIKAEIFPYKDVEIEKLLAILIENNFLHKYRVASSWYGEVVNFKKHQYIQKNEASSELPGPDLADELLIINDNVLSINANGLGCSKRTVRAGIEQGTGTEVEGSGEKEALVQLSKHIRMTNSELEKLISRCGIQIWQEQLPEMDEWVEKADTATAKRYRRPIHNHYLFAKRWLEGATLRTGARPSGGLKSFKQQDQDRVEASVQRLLTSAMEEQQNGTTRNENPNGSNGHLHGSGNQRGEGIGLPRAATALRLPHGTKGA